MLFDSTLRRELARNFGAHAGRHPDDRADDHVHPHPRPGRGRPRLAAGRGAAARLHRARPPADDAGAVAVRRRRRDAGAHVPRQRDGDLVRQRRALPRFVRPVLRTSWPVLLLIGVLALFVWPWQNERSAELKDASSGAPTCRAWRRASSRPRATASASSSSRAAPSDTGDRPQRLHRRLDAAASNRSPRPQRAASRPTATAASWCSTKGQRNEQNASNGEKTLSRFESYRARWPASASVDAARDPAAEARCRRCELLREPTASNQGELAWRLGLVLGRRQPAAARHRPVGLEPAPRQQLEPAVRAARLLRLLQPHQPDAGLGRRRPARPRRRAARRCTAARFVLGARRCSGGASTGSRGADGAAPPPAAPARRREPHEDGPPAVLRRHRLRGRVRRARVPVAVLLHRLRRRAAATSASAATPRCTRPLYSLLLAPGHLYELLPIAVLIGTIYALARLAQTSEYTILRTGGLGPGRALGLLAALALVFGAVTFVVGDYVAPLSRERRQPAARRRSAAASSSAAPAPGSRSTPTTPEPASAATRSTSARPSAGGGAARRPHLRVRRRRPAARAASPRPRPGSQRDGTWTLADVTRHPLARRRRSTPTAPQERLATLDWQSTLSPEVVAAAVLPVTHDVDGRAVALHRPPRRERAGRAAAGDPVLEARALPVRLPGDGRRWRCPSPTCTRAPAASA